MSYLAITETDLRHDSHDLQAFQLSRLALPAFIHALMMLSIRMRLSHDLDMNFIRCYFLPICTMHGL